jgi:cyanophycinase-like exopeptidase
MGDQLGGLALVGSGEYTPAMATTDRWLIEGLGGPAHANVALIPTASGLEEGQPERWNILGAAHFTALGARPTPLHLISHEDAVAPTIVSALQAASFFYFSGGNPEYLAETFEGTPAWEAVTARHRAGAVIAGCSAGAMFLGSYLLRVRAIREGRGPIWRHGLGLAAGLVILPHFDRMSRFLDAERFREVLAGAPAGATVIGIDEDTALVRLTPTNAGPRRWRVMGRQSVSVFAADGHATAYPSGEELTLG